MDSNLWNSVELLDTCLEFEKLISLFLHVNLEKFLEPYCVYQENEIQVLVQFWFSYSHK